MSVKCKSTENYFSPWYYERYILTWTNSKYMKREGTNEVIILFIFFLYFSGKRGKKKNMKVKRKDLLLWMIDPVTAISRRHKRDGGKMIIFAGNSQK